MAEEDVNWLDWLAMVLVIVGALNWGLVGLGIVTGGNWNVVNLLFGGVANGVFEALIYLLVGLAGLYEIYFGYKLS